eukprot:32543-Eustigmatos_ZCMA.PRE.1
MAEERAIDGPFCLVFRIRCVGWLRGQPAQQRLLLRPSSMAQGRCRTRPSGRRRGSCGGKL